LLFVDNLKNVEKGLKTLKKKPGNFTEHLKILQKVLKPLMSCRNDAKRLGTFQNI